MKIANIKHINPSGVEPFQGSDLAILFSSDFIGGYSNSSLSGLTKRHCITYYLLMRIMGCCAKQSP